MTWMEAVPLTILALTGPPSAALAVGVALTGTWPWRKR